MEVAVVAVVYCENGVYVKESKNLHFRDEIFFKKIEIVTNHFF